MKKTLRNILIMAGVLVLIGGAALALILTQPETDTGDGGESSSLSEMIVDTDPAGVSSITVTNTKGSYTLVPDENKDPGVFKLEGYEKYLVMDSDIATVVSNTTSIASTRDLGSVDELEDLADYGLAGTGESSVTVNREDGNNISFVLGSVPGSGTGRYMLLNDRVYTVGSLSIKLFESGPSFLINDVYSIPDRAEAGGTITINSENEDSESSESSEEEEQTVADILYSFEVSGKDIPNPIVIEYNTTVSGDYLITSPTRSESGTASFETLMADLKSLEAHDVVAIEATESDLEEYGLADPYATVSFNMNGHEHTLSVSEKDNTTGYRFLSIDGNGIIYEVAAEDVASWAETSIMDLQMSYVWLPMIVTIEDFKATVGDKDYAVHIDRKLNEEKSNDYTKVYDYFPSIKGGDDLVYENYQHFYTQILEITVLNCEPLGHEEKPAYTTSYTLFDNRGSTKVEYYASTEKDQRYAAYVDGEYAGQVRKDAVDAAFSLADELFAGENIHPDLQ